MSLNLTVTDRIGGAAAGIDLWGFKEMCKYTWSTKKKIDGQPRRKILNMNNHLIGVESRRLQPPHQRCVRTQCMDSGP